MKIASSLPIFEIQSFPFPFLRIEVLTHISLGYTSYILRGSTYFCILLLKDISTTDDQVYKL